MEGGSILDVMAITKSAISVSQAALRLSSGHLLQLRPRLPGVPTFLELRLRLFQGPGPSASSGHAGRTTRTSADFQGPPHLIDAADHHAIGQHVVVVVAPLAGRAGGCGALEDELGNPFNSLRSLAAPLVLRGELSLARACRFCAGKLACVAV